MHKYASEKGYVSTGLKPNALIEGWSVLSKRLTMTGKISPKATDILLAIITIF